MPALQCGTESIVVVPFRSISPDFTAATRSNVLMGAPAELYDRDDFDPRLFLN